MVMQGSIEECWTRFKNIIIDLVSKYIPRKKPNQKGCRKALWMTNEVVQLARKKYKTFAKHKDSLHSACIRAAKAADKEVEYAKANFEKRLADNIKTDSKSFFAYVRERSKSKVKVGPLINSTGRWRMRMVWLMNLTHTLHQSV